MRKSILSILYLSLTLAISSHVAAGDITILGLPSSKLLTKGNATVSFKPDPRNITVLKISANGTTEAKPGSVHSQDNEYIPSTSQESISTPESPLLSKPIKLTKLNLQPLVVVETLKDGKIKLQSPHSLIKSITFGSPKKLATYPNKGLWNGFSDLSNDSTLYICCAGFSKITLELNLDALAELMALQPTP